MWSSVAGSRCPILVQNLTSLTSMGRVQLTLERHSLIGGLISRILLSFDFVIETAHGSVNSNGLLLVRIGVECIEIAKRLVEYDGAAILHLAVLCVLHVNLRVHIVVFVHAIKRRTLNIALIKVDHARRFIRLQLVDF